MLTENTDGPLLRALETALSVHHERYEPRPGQLVMARAVKRALDDHVPLLVEAGTGTGKTLAYLLPAALSGRRVVISTGSRQLQDQIALRDVPVASRVLDRELDVAVLKGVSNYVCRRKAAGVGASADASLGAIVAWQRHAQTGDRSQLPAIPDDDPAWAEVTTSASQRLGPGCPFHATCFVTRAREAAHRARITIVNHHLLLASLALRHPEQTLLPPYDVLIVDEAHQLEDLAIEHFGVHTAGDELHQALTSHRGALVLTSGTLTVGGRFDHVRSALGLDVAAGCRELSVPSPFRFEDQALLYLPRDLPGTSDPGFEAATHAEMRRLCDLTGGRAFLLFTSHAALTRAAEALADMPCTLLVQGQAPQAALTQRFRLAQHAVLLGTYSFWEGIDVPGDALSLVVVSKLPFASPDEPTWRQRIEALEDEGVDPFTTLQLPRAVLRLKQGFGRLIRSASDRGIVAVLDNRIVTRSYGRVFLQSLPACRRTSSFEQVRRWWS